MTAGNTCKNWAQKDDLSKDISEIKDSLNLITSEMKQMEKDRVDDRNLVNRLLTQIHSMGAEIDQKDTRIVELEKST